MAMVTHSVKVAIGDVTGNEKAQMHEEDKGMEEEEIPIHQSIAKWPQKDVEKHNPIPKVKKPLPKISPQFPQRLKKKNEDEKFKKFLSVFKTLSINLRLVEVLLEMSGYAIHLMCMSEPLEAVLANYNEFEIQDCEEVVAALFGLGGGLFKDPIEVGH
ncbi:hypothetical protein R3W88_024451 [Solanum pinnatisectum]|uniref:Uncharacterized protein n=1 Tax=Solanum pinnatisectum TaxID=50273 RepID=A0AAV9M188_9SOLN|nr:hypothetical protein R3W88_024451 [Solanum pinnatisectum]